MTTANHLDTFKFLGVELGPSRNGELLCDCPFCGKKKLSINEKEGLYNCFVCNSKGNKYTYLQTYYDWWLERTTVDHYEELANLRSTETKQPHFGMFEQAQLAYDADQDRWLIPVLNEKGSMVNLRVWARKRGKRIMMNTAGCAAHIYKADELPNADTVYVCEGEWDAIMLEWLLGEVGDVNSTVVAVPGASTFKDSWAEKFRNKQVILCYDNDDAGRDGVNKVVRSLSRETICRGIQHIQWPESYENKFDVSDLVLKHITTPLSAYEQIQRMLSEDVTVRKTVPGCENFDQLVERFSEKLYMTEGIEKALLLTLSVMYSNDMPGDPLWLFIVGPPGSGKTLMLQTASSHKDKSYWISSMTSKTLVSGFAGKGGQDCSQILKIMGKTMIVKDYTEILALPLGEQEEIYGQLRGAYDGYIHKAYGNGVVRRYPPPGDTRTTCHFSMVAGVTKDIYKDKRAHLGERFLYFSMVPNDFDDTEQIQCAISNVINNVHSEIELQDSVVSFLDQNPMDPKNLAKVPKWFQDRIIPLAQMVSILRGVVSRKNGEMAYRPSPEVGTRVAKQLIRLAQCVAFVLREEELTEEIYHLMVRVAWDTCHGWHRDVVAAILHYGSAGALRSEIEAHASLSPTTVKRALDDLLELRAVRYDLEDTGKKGQPPKIWSLRSNLAKMVKASKLSENPMFEDMTAPLAEMPRKITRNL